MSCFSLAGLESLIVYIIVLAAIIAIIQILIPWLTSMIGVPVIGQIISIILWAVVAIMIVYLIFALLSCLIGGAGNLRLFPR